MTNDDRSNEDRTGDGSAPVWGSAPRHDQHDAPRYGERVDPAPGSAPQYGEQHQGQPQYGERDQYGQQPQYGQHHGHQQDQYGQHDGRQDSPTWGEHQGSHQPYAASSAPASAGSPAWQSYEEPKRKKKTVGVVAFVLGLASLVLGVVGGYLMGNALANSNALSDIAQGGGASAEQQQQLQQQLMNDPAVMGQLGVGAVVAGIAAILGLWALVQGIIAAVTKRGRGWGVFAIVLAVVATIATFVTYIGVAAAAAVNGAS
ncbi:phage holin family protein [Curtobacterium sp. MCSS17_007]|uniref:phage holin family protein n=1 Tax=Curtobacterium sp. MCSS17_007 TaxID=2175646 RepID=UPI000DA8C296|nr:phage holin family protein [Curtobacterium sp. MCSS17_007]WIE75499.1 phage holin family protein [Curtobacterium sp. MCSS17_007]